MPANQKSSRDDAINLNDRSRCAQAGFRLNRGIVKACALQGRVLWYLPGPLLTIRKGRSYFGWSFLTGIPHKNLNGVAPVFS